MFFISDFLNLYSTRYVSEFDLENEDNDDDDKSTTNNERHKEIARNEQKKKHFCFLKHRTPTHTTRAQAPALYTKKKGRKKLKFE